MASPPPVGRRAGRSFQFQRPREIALTPRALTPRDPSIPPSLPRRHARPALRRAMADSPSADVPREEPSDPGSEQVRRSIDRASPTPGRRTSGQGTRITFCATFGRNEKSRIARTLDWSIRRRILDIYPERPARLPRVDPEPRADPPSALAGAGAGRGRRARQREEEQQIHRASRARSRVLGLYALS